jgi:hypothetical protein
LLELFAALIHVKIPSGLLEPLGCSLSVSLGFALFFFGALGFAIRWPLANELFYILTACRSAKRNDDWKLVVNAEIEAEL